jgi:hypothetical protein
MVIFLIAKKKIENFENAGRHSRLFLTEVENTALFSHFILIFMRFIHALGTAYTGPICDLS